MEGKKTLFRLDSLEGGKNSFCVDRSHLRVGRVRRGDVGISSTAILLEQMPATVVPRLVNARSWSRTHSSPGTVFWFFAMLHLPVLPWIALTGGFDIVSFSTMCDPLWIQNPLKTLGTVKFGTKRNSCGDC